MRKVELLPSQICEADYPPPMSHDLNQYQNVYKRLSLKILCSQLFTFLDPKEFEAGTTHLPLTLSFQATRSFFKSLKWAHALLS